jgi:hypothetical protein
MMNPQDLIRSIMTALDNISSSEQQPQDCNHDGNYSNDTRQDPNTPEVTKAPNLAMLVPIEFDQTDHTDSTKPIFPVPGFPTSHGAEANPQSGFSSPSTSDSDCGCSGNANEPDELDLIMRAAGINRRPEE